MKLLFACPTYGPVDPIAGRHQRVAIMHAAQYAGVTWVGDLSPDRVGFAGARNVIAAGAIEETEADAVFWVDSDVVLPPDAITKLVLEGIATGKEFLTGMYFQRYPPHFPLIAHFDPVRESFDWLIEWPENCIAPIDGCGFGCVLTSTALLKAVDRPWFTFEKYSEDFDFCLKAARAGYQLHVHTGVLCGHLADPKPITAADFVAARRDTGHHHGAVRPDAAA